MSLLCALSGEPLTSDTADEIVVTPSGHICLKRLILTKLSENEGVDPFSDSARPLSEGDLVALQISKKKASMPPPPSSASSFSGTLQRLAKEYDSIVLELYDTRKVLQETRRELSQALYQNDAAIRVVARLSMERDAARLEAEQFSPTALAGHPLNGVKNDSQAPSKKKPRIGDDADLPLANDIPSTDLDAMLSEWEKLHKARRSKPKTTSALPEHWKVLSSKSWHKSTCRGLTAIRQSQKWLVTAGKDKQIVVYDFQAERAVATFPAPKDVTSLDAMPKEGTEDSLIVVAACDKELYVFDSSAPGVEKMNSIEDTIVSLSGHPTRRHCCVATKGGKVTMFRILAGDIHKIQHISTFSSTDKGVEYCCSALHPDGLLFAAGTAKGQIHLWDLKNKQVGATFRSEKEDTAVGIAFSSNGYHFASAHASGAVRVWDMRKNKMLAEMNITGDKLLNSVKSLAFHPDGKHLAYAGDGGVHVTSVKEWKVSAQLPVKDATGVVWHPEWIVSTSGSERAVTFHVGEKK